MDLQVQPRHATISALDGTRSEDAAMVVSAEKTSLTSLIPNAGPQSGGVSAAASSVILTAGQDNVTVRGSFTKFMTHCLWEFINASDAASQHRTWTAVPAYRKAEAGALTGSSTFSAYLTTGRLLCRAGVQ